MGTSIPSNIKDYKNIVKNLLIQRKILENRKTEEQIKESTLTIKDMNHIQYIDTHITGINLFAEKKLRNKKGKHQWSPSFDRAHALVTYWHIPMTQLRTCFD